MRILLVGNHTCGNRGDGAILRGLLDSLRLNDSTVDLDILSRYAVSSEYLLGESMIQDDLYSSRISKKNGLISKLKNKIINKIMPFVLVSHAKKNGFLRYYPLPKHISDFVNSLKDYDAIIQVGGSFFVDLYGSGQFEHILCSAIANKPIYLIGHSVGPFEINSFNKIAHYAFSKSKQVILREDVSRNLMLKDNFDMSNVTMGVDTAFLVQTDIIISDYIISHWLQLIDKKKTVAITVRKLAPFDRRLGVTQKEYEIVIVRMINYLISKGYQVIAFSTCTGIESYHNDDRMVALSIQKLVNNESFHVVMDEINDLQLGALLNKCSFTIGTRLHSAIISINFGTPAIAINYEHKSLGVMQGLNMNELSASVDDLINSNIIKKIDFLISNYEEINQKLYLNLTATRELGHTMVAQVLKSIGEK
ncbi:colanic acid biosynthesis pyruvyl transferase WcaK [Klebsiella huaxiensis]|uniref:Colanic acid biosynthesis pyruvyl transferase WcaK n=1 Tax=Klebsiella huaxiensis TaxID=2153354 RepID=A0ABT6EIB8_9ENTR|nr:colanic acid biosynthesis pyruvyl transferase WcaK [Klebsiella huaxiensis]MDG1644314.1 colanic acid biosynthesis pyruvyl transferase WcaK [Klebsiella huaxiensis]